MIERVHLFAVPRQVAGLREGLGAGGAGVGAVAGVAACGLCQVAGRPAGLAEGGTGVGEPNDAGEECKELLRVGWGWRRRSLTALRETMSVRRSP